MALVKLSSLMKHALENKYAVGYFESWNMESLLAVTDAAEKTNSPVIIGFNGTFLGNEERDIEENIYHYGALGKIVAEQVKVPVALLLNEADKVSILVKGLKAGFNAIMYENSSDSFEQAVKITKYLVRTAHYCDADVEAELGSLPTADISTNTISQGVLTDPEQAVYFVEQTGVDALAVAVGNVHLLEGKKSNLNFDLIKTLRDRLRVPLVLHGGTGILEEDIKEAIKLGVCKINVGTVLKRAFINAIDSYLKLNNVKEMNPHDVIGKGGKLDVLSKARSCVTEEIIRYIRMFGSEGKAKIW